jgi:DNA replication protein DnaC
LLAIEAFILENTGKVDVIPFYHCTAAGNLLNRRIKLAHFPVIKTLEEFDFDFNPLIKKKEIIALSSVSFIHRAQNVLLVGLPGVG